MDPIEICKTSRAVREFMDACDDIRSKNPGFNSKTGLWRKLVDEEYGELMLAMDNAMAYQDPVNYAEILDACCDLVWVTIGLAYNMGLPFDEASELVKQTNMAKINAKTGKVFRRGDGKILKPEGWTPPDILTLIKEKSK